MTAGTLANLLTNPGVIENDAPQNGHLFAVAYTDDGVIHLTKNAYTSYLYATLLHEAFHLIGPETTKFHNDMLNAMKNHSSRMPLLEEPRTGYIAANCGGLK